MKKNFLCTPIRCLAFSLAFPFLSAAQSAFGVQGGINLSDATISGPTPYVASSQGNYFLGLQARNLLHQRWGISSDAQWTKRGFFLNQVRSMSEHRLGFQLMYIDLASKIEHTVFRNIGLQGGAYAGYRLVEYDQVVGSDQWVKAALPATEKWDVGLQAGIVARFQRWSAFARYSHGLLAVSQLEVTDEVDRIKIFNRGGQIGASYSFFIW